MAYKLPEYRPPLRVAHTLPEPQEKLKKCLSTKPLNSLKQVIPAAPQHSWGISEGGCIWGPAGLFGREVFLQREDMTQAARPQSREDPSECQGQTGLQSPEFSPDLDGQHWREPGVGVRVFYCPLLCSLCPLPYLVACTSSLVVAPSRAACTRASEAEPQGWGIQSSLHF